MIIQSTIIPFSIVYRFLPPHWLSLMAVCCTIGTLQITFMYGPVLATIHDLTPVRLRATMTALLLIGLNIFGASLGAAVAALLTEVTGSFTWGTSSQRKPPCLRFPFSLWLSAATHPTWNASHANRRIGTFARGGIEMREAVVVASSRTPLAKSFGDR